MESHSVIISACYSLYHVRSPEGICPRVDRGSDPRSAATRYRSLFPSGPTRTARARTSKALGLVENQSGDELPHSQSPLGVRQLVTALSFVRARRAVLARVPKDRLPDRQAYEFFQRLDGQGSPLWSADVQQRGPVFSHSGNCYRSGISYCAGLRRYVWCQTLPQSDDPRGPRFQGGLGIFDAPQPWGPWTTAYFTTTWDVGPGETSSFPPKWMSQDGTILHLVFSGDDHFSVRRATLEIAR